MQSFTAGSDPRKRRLEGGRSLIFLFASAGGWTWLDRHRFVHASVSFIQMNSQEMSEVGCVFSRCIIIHRASRDVVFMCHNKGSPVSSALVAQPYHSRHILSRGSMGRMTPVPPARGCTQMPLQRLPVIFRGGGERMLGEGVNESQTMSKAQVVGAISL